MLCMIMKATSEVRVIFQFGGRPGTLLTILCNEADRAVLQHDPMIQIDRGAGSRQNPLPPLNLGPVIGVNEAQIVDKAGGEGFGFSPEDAVNLVRPAHFAGVQGLFPIAEMGDGLGLGEAGFSGQAQRGEECDL